MQKLGICLIPWKGLFSKPFDTSLFQWLMFFYNQKDICYSNILVSGVCLLDSINAKLSILDGICFPRETGWSKETKEDNRLRTAYVTIVTGYPCLSFCTTIGYFNLECTTIAFWNKRPGRFMKMTKGRLLCDIDITDQDWRRGGGKYVGICGGKCCESGVKKYVKNMFQELISDI